MVSWIWIPVSLFVGAVISLFLYALCVMSGKWGGNE